MTIEQISNRLIQLLEQKSFLQAQIELFDENVQNIEPKFHPRSKTEGLQNLLGKERQFLDNIQSWKSYELSGPLMSEDHFAIKMSAQILLKSGRTMDLDEIIVYQVFRGKIICEMFFMDLRDHSSFNASAGFAVAALTVWIPTVNQAMSKAVRPAITNNHHSMVME